MSSSASNSIMINCDCLVGKLLFSFLLLIPLAILGSTDVGSETAEVKILHNLDKRSINTSVEKPAVDDSGLEKTWYTGKSGDGLYRLSSLSNGKPSAGKCGTLYPIYLNAPFPELEDGKELDLQLCLIGFFGENECEHTYDIKVRQIAGEIHYFLLPTARTSAYCFELETAPAPDYIIPEIPLVTADLRYTSECDLRIPNIEFTCDFIPSPTETYYYSISWYVNNKFLRLSKPTLMEDISQTKLTEDDILQTNMSLGFNLKCGVSVSAEISGLRTEEQVSSSFFAGVEVDRQTIEVQRGQSGSVYVRQTIPLGCTYSTVLPDDLQDCSIALSTVDISQSFDQACKDKEPLVAVESSVHCGVSLQGQKYSECNPTSGLCPKQTYDWQLITVKPINDFYDYETKISFKLLLKTKDFNKGNRVWRDYMIQTIHVNMIDDQRWTRKSCRAYGDPQMVTFDKRKYSHHVTENEFIMYKHRNQQIEVQYKTRYCRRLLSRACICSVIVRAGGDMWAFIICDDLNFIGFLSCKEGILDVKVVGASYRVDLPTGTYMYVRFSRWTKNLDVTIYSSPEDIGNTEGHCGLLNDNSADDFLDRNGQVVGSSTLFIRAWRVNEDDSFLKVNNQDPANWRYEFYVCVCPNPSGPLSNVTVCSPSQTASCRITKPENGQSNICISRRKRSVTYDRKEIRRRFGVIEQETAPTHREKKSANTDLGKTFEEGYEECLQYFQSKELYRLRDILPEARLNESLFACAEDASYMEGVSPFTPAHFEGWAEAIGDEIQRNKSFRTTSAEAVYKYAETYCPDECNTNGYCINGICNCNPGFGGRTCFITKSDILTIKDIEGGGVCDGSEGDHCHECLKLQTEYLTDEFTCRIDVNGIDPNGNSKLIESFQQRGEYENIFEGYCCLQVESSRKKRFSSSADFFTKYEISISNDGEHFGPSESVVVIDSTCQQTQEMSDGEVFVSLKSGFCFINGQCYEQGDKYTSWGCDVCNTSLNLFQWSNGCKQAESSTSSFVHEKGQNDQSKDEENSFDHENGQNGQSKDEEGKETDTTVIITVCSLTGVTVALIAIIIIVIFVTKQSKSRRSISASNPSLVTNQNFGPGNTRHQMNAHTKMQTMYGQGDRNRVMSPFYLQLDEPPTYETITPSQM